MSVPFSYGHFTKQELLRWSVCFATMLALHGGIAAALLTTQTEGDVLDTVSAVEVDFTTESFKDAQARDIAPGEEQMQTDVAPPPMEKAELKSEAETEPVKDEQPKQDEPVPTPPLPAVENPDVALATAAPTEKKTEDDKKDEAEKTPNAAPPLVSASTTTAPTAAAVRTGSVLSWKRKLAMHLQRNKRYPAAAQARREHGIAKVSFVVDRTGHVISSNVVKSSGSAALDRETLDLLQRAQPLPTPPADVPGTQFAFSVPVRFDLK
ncbi:translocase [Afipia sp. P52-10]|jgi:protein TonB|uniref:TonB family protein n=1 Tax=Afipia sp. P52-10 TaxID=1429916 RepID=UPI0003DF1D7C|nr:energy transducer TonB [Afipia sp. P52-10]ETR76604.1 translocase [Afipia sp. P52-10]